MDLDKDDKEVEVKKERRRKSITKDEMEELLDHMQYRLYKSNRVIDEGLNQKIIDRLDELETIMRQLASKDGIAR